MCANKKERPLTTDTKLDDILNFTEQGKLVDFIKSYAQKDAAFNNALLKAFSPNRPSNNKQLEPQEDYEKLIQSAFVGQPSRRSGRYGYYNDYDDIGFDAEAVSEELDALLEKARYYIKYQNIEEAILIAQKMIETIPDEWDQNFDYEGDVQVVYDEAIDLLESLLEQDLLSDEQKESLFDWYEQEIKDKKHADVGLNTSLDSLGDYFLTGVRNGFERTLHIIDRQIKASSDYTQEALIEKKIHLLYEFNHSEEADKTIVEFLHLPGVRKIRLQQMLEKNEYLPAVNLINKGIEIAEKKKHSGIINSWKEDLLEVYKLLGNKEKELEFTKELFVKSNDSRKYYKLLKSITPKADWKNMLEWILKSLGDGSYYGTNNLKADILIEHKMWDDLWNLCQKGNISDIEKHEKLLRPKFDDEIFKIYVAYAERQAEVTDKDAYKRVADTLIRMKTFARGKEIVKQLVANYRQKYKRRPYMMKELDRV